MDSKKKLTVKDAKAGIAEAMRYLADNSIDVSSVKLSRPTLEQVYMSIVGAQWN